MNFAHVEDNRLRQILEVGSTEDHDLEYALEVTECALNNDAGDEMVEDEVFSARSAAHLWADTMFHDGAMGVCLKYLQRYWSV